MAAAVTTHLRVITNSELRAHRACARRHRYAYGLRRRPIESAMVLRFGTLWHVGQEAWWSLIGDASPADRYIAGRDAMRASKDIPDPYALVTTEELLLGYTARWSEVSFRTIVVEKSFEVPLVNPETGHASRTFVVGGKLDVIAEVEGVVCVVEHKTTAKDIEPGSLYWRQITSLDTQVSTYLDGASRAGFDVQKCVYDVVRKPGMKPSKATPPEQREYTKPKDRACKACKKGSAPPHVEIVGEGDDAREVSCVDGRIVTDPGGRLYANMRESDETPEEFRQRVRTDIAERPDRYFARADVVRLDHDEREHAFDIWQQARLLRDGELAGYAPRNPDACMTWGPCPYFAVCCNEASIDDDLLFRTAATAHEELENE